MRVLVTGCGRAGTQFLACLFNELRLTDYPIAGHEKVFDGEFFPGRPFDKQLFRDKTRKNTPIEVSWMAAPFLDQLPSGTIIYHQLRDPLKVARCWRHHDLLFMDEKTRPTVTQFIHEFVPECSLGSGIERAIKYVVNWNLHIEKHTHYRYQIESLDSSLIATMLLHAGFQVEQDHIDNILNGFPHVGACEPGRKDYPGEAIHLPLTWDNIRNSPSGMELVKLAQRYGYPTE